MKTVPHEYGYVCTWTTEEITVGRSNSGNLKILNKEIDVKTLDAVKTFPSSANTKTPNVAKETCKERVNGINNKTVYPQLGTLTITYCALVLY